MKPINIRSEKGSQDPSQKGEGATYFIPSQDVPEGIKSGEQGRIILEGLINTDEQGVTIDIERIKYEAIGKRTDPLQDKIEEGLKIEMNVSTK